MFQTHTLSVWTLGPMAVYTLSVWTLDPVGADTLSVWTLDPMRSVHTQCLDIGPCGSIHFFFLLINKAKTKVFLSSRLALQITTQMSGSLGMNCFKESK